MIETFDPTAIVLSENAVQQVKAISTGEPNIRAYITGGGCSGFEYRFDIEQTPTDDDFSYDYDGVTLYVDFMSHQYLQGSTIDYQVDLMGSRFVITNPNATSTCGCGMSFSI